MAQPPPAEFAKALEQPHEPTGASDGLAGEASAAGGSAGAGEGAEAVQPANPWVGPRPPSQLPPPWGTVVALHFTGAHLAALKARAQADLQAEHAAGATDSPASDRDGGGMTAAPPFVSTHDALCSRMWQVRKCT